MPGKPPGFPLPKELIELAERLVRMLGPSVRDALEAHDAMMRRWMSIFPWLADPAALDAIIRFAQAPAERDPAADELVAEMRRRQAAGEKLLSQREAYRWLRSRGYRWKIVRPAQAKAWAILRKRGRPRKTRTGPGESRTSREKPTQEPGNRHKAGRKSHKN